MPVLSYLHQLFNADTCHAYLHTLRWKDRPLQCPRCHSHDVSPWGMYHHRPGCKRSWCHGCDRTFNDLTNTLLHQSKRSLSYWLLATFLLCLSCSSHRLTRELGIRVHTSYRWCWRLRNAALSYEMDRQLAGTVEADDLYHTAGNKGQAKGGGKKSLGRRARGRRKKREPGRGHDEKDRPAIIAWVSRQGAVVLQATKGFTVKTVQKATDLAVRKGSRLSTDSASSYRALKGYLHEYVNQLGRHKARCVAVRLLMPPIENRTYHFHGIRLSTCGSSPCSHEAFLPISPAPQCIPRGQLARSLGTFVPGFPQARGLRHESSSSCGQLSCPRTTLPHPTLPAGIELS
jgi:transposase-like protein